MFPLLSECIRFVVEFLYKYKAFSIEHAAQLTSTHNISCSHFHQRASGGWWKSPIRHFLQSIVSSELLKISSSTYIYHSEGRVGSGNGLLESPVNWVNVTATSEEEAAG